MAQGLFLGGTGRRAVAHTRPAFAKMPTAPSAFPWLGAPQAPGDEPHPPEGGKSLGGEGPLRLKEISRYWDTLGQIRAADNTAGRNATRHLESCQTDSDLRYLMHAPPYGHVWHKAFFLGGTGRRAVAHTRPEFVKNTLGPFGIPLVRGALGAGQWTQPSRRR